MDERPTNCRFPSIDIYSSPRVINQKVNNSNIPLLKYKQLITASNRSNSYEGDYVEKGHLRKINENDGLIFQIKDMKSQVENQMRENNANHTGEDINNEVRAPVTERENCNIKILVCVCMYNESKNAINLTLNGIYKNLPSLKK